MRISSTVKSGVFTTNKPNKVTVEIGGGKSSNYKSKPLFAYDKQNQKGLREGNLRVYVNQHLALDRFVGAADQKMLKYISLTSASNGTREEFFYNCADDSNNNTYPSSSSEEITYW